MNVQQATIATSAFAIGLHWSTRQDDRSHGADTRV